MVIQIVIDEQAIRESVDRELELVEKYGDDNVDRTCVCLIADLALRAGIQGVRIHGEDHLVGNEYYQNSTQMKKVITEYDNIVLSVERGLIGKEPAIRVCLAALSLPTTLTLGGDEVCE